MRMGKAGLWLISLLVSGACGPTTSNVTTSGESTTEMGTSTSGVATTSSVAGTTSSTSTSSASTASESTSTSAGADSTTTGGPISCYPPGNDCPEGQCCQQDVPGIFLCAPFGFGCSCSTDRDCGPGETCIPTGFKGELNCAECDHDDDCMAGESCVDYQCEPSATTSGTGTGSSSG